MIKSNLQITPKAIALPLQIGYEKTPAYLLIAVRFLCFLWQIVRINEPKKELIEVPETPLPAEPEPMKATKAYADQRQKSKKRRRRKPSKAMRNLYQLG